MKLTDGREGMQYRIERIDMEERDRKRLFHIGLYKNTMIKIEKQGKRQLPSVYLVSGNLIMLRYKDAQRIEVRPL